MLRRVFQHSFKELIGEGGSCARSGPTYSMLFEIPPAGLFSVTADAHQLGAYRRRTPRSFRNNGRFLWPPRALAALARRSFDPIPLQKSPAVLFVISRNASKFRAFVIRACLSPCNLGRLRRPMENPSLSPHTTTPSFPCTQLARKVIKSIAFSGPPTITRKTPFAGTFPRHF
jgi:hypothetical protein